MRRTTSMLAVVCVLVAALATPAWAGVEIVYANVFGTAEVGDTLVGDANIPQDGDCELAGKGLHYPGFGGPGKQRDKLLGSQVNKQVYYHFALPQFVMTWLDTNNPTGFGAYAGTLHVCGIVSPGPFGIGAAAGSSTGHDGRGKITVFGPKGLLVFDLQEVGWRPALAGVLHPYGLIKRVSADKATKFSAKGTFQAFVHAVPTNPDHAIQPKPGGARDFTLRGTLVGAMLGKAPKPNPPKLND